MVRSYRFGLVSWQNHGRDIPWASGLLDESDRFDTYVASEFRKLRYRWPSKRNPAPADWTDVRLRGFLGVTEPPRLGRGAGLADLHEPTVASSEPFGYVE